MKNNMNSTTENIESITISRAEYDSMKQEIEQLAGINNWLREQLENLKKNQFGSKRETASDEVIGQMMLFDEPEVYAYLEEFRNRRTTVAEHERALKKERVFLLDKLPSNAEVEVEVHALSEEERKCSVCESEMKLRGQVGVYLMKERL